MSMDLVTLIGRNHCVAPLILFGQHCGLGRGPDPYPPTVLCLKMRETLLWFFRENKHYFDGKKATPPWMSIDLVTDIHWSQCPRPTPIRGRRPKYCGTVWWWDRANFRCFNDQWGHFILETWTPGGSPGDWLVWSLWRAQQHIQRAGVCIEIKM